MNDIALVTDSTCDIPSDLIAQYQIYVQAHVIVWGQEQLRDRIDLLPEAFYRRLVSSDVFPTTSQATINDFATTFHKACDDGAREIVAVIVSGALSGALQSVINAAQEIPIPVHIHDSRLASMGLGWQVLAAARARQAGGGVCEMLAAAEAVRQKSRLVIYLDTMEYLYRGGRIGNARRLLGALLNIKPLIMVDPDSGLVEPVGMAHSRRHGIEHMVKNFFEHFQPGCPQHVAVMHGDSAADAAVLYERLQKEYPGVELLTDITTPTLGIHTGPRAIALAGYSD
jgi:DegV family protein with EDD domain